MGSGETVVLNLWYYLLSMDVCVCVPAKCGGTAFYQAAFHVHEVEPRHVKSAVDRLASMSGAGPYTPIEVSTYYPTKRKIMAVRHPVQRFVSLWRDKCRDGDENMPMVAGWDPETLLQHIKEYPAGNDHWMPQYLYQAPGCEVVDYQKLMPLLGLKAERVNVTYGKETDPEMPKTDIIRQFQQDYFLWRNHCADDS